MANSIHFCIHTALQRCKLFRIAKQAVVLLLSFSVYSAYAETRSYDLPDLGSEQNTFHNDQTKIHKAKQLERYLKEFTRTQLTDSTSVRLARKGIKIETLYTPDMWTELSTEGDDEVTFTFKLSF